MSIRFAALKWFSSNYKEVGDPFYTSKYYLPEESWNKEHTWWLEIPLKLIEVMPEGYISFLCQVAPNENAFHYLKVPKKFLREHLQEFHLHGRKISLYLSPDNNMMFTERRGIGNLNFMNFLVANPNA